MSGLFITLEGGEGSGKSSQIRQLKQFFETNYPQCELTITREPGGTPEAETIRDILVNGQVDKLTPQTEALLMIAARAEHVAKIIRPALARGAVIICDRFSDSSVVYQGLAANIDKSNIDLLHQFAIDDLKPDRTYLLDLPAEIGLERAQERASAQTQAESRFEDKGLLFHNRVREGFLSLSRQDPDRFITIDATLSQDQVFSIIKADLDHLLLRAGITD